jgi:hypothetical protein
MRPCAPLTHERRMTANSSTTNKARSVQASEERKAQLALRLQREVRMKPHEALAMAKQILASPAASGVDVAVRHTLRVSSMAVGASPCAAP